MPTARLTLALGILAMGALPAAAEPPADAFCVITIEPLDGFRIVRVTVDQETNLTDRQELWPQVDRDGDGQVTPAERVAFMRSTLASYSNASALRDKALVAWDPTRAASIPAAAPMAATTWREIGHTFHQRDYRIPETITEASDLETQEIREFRFAHTAPLDRATLRGGAGALDTPVIFTTTSSYPTTVIEYVVVRAPEGWLVESLSGESYNGTVSAQPWARVVDIPAFDTKRPFEITFARDPSWNVPPPAEPPVTVTQYATVTVTAAASEPGSTTAAGAAFAVLVALAAAAVLARRKLP